MLFLISAKFEGATVCFLPANPNGIRRLAMIALHRARYVKLTLRHHVAFCGVMANFRDHLPL
jgi:hypothetical protein